ncbi:BTB/POZ domain-containing protein [Cavenderia fasciculata]|uniref:BTB/POZ domain-containing protein n=1 Tax=Cavenderia fasciculata TaxID=261658 RepID=F4PU81_CACFS|nr:BTB/POZ domain-containing protein [Cavenderia fasciculata]EGG21796.1 BTB/POZ domain-containing protein [Cavenderia fasciculata]|eukprot:XP_004359646.1 BTB/POZ domain-containing protein [Cavenderia fasciculata]
MTTININSPLQQGSSDAIDISKDRIKLRGDDLILENNMNHGSGSSYTDLASKMQTVDIVGGGSQTNTAHSSNRSSVDSTNSCLLDNFTLPSDVDQQASSLINRKGMIKLNVGGVLYYTSVSTLCTDPTSMFSLMFSGRFPIQREEDGSVFIDRDGRYFHYILNWLRNNSLPPIIDELEKQYVLVEARFYLITGLVDHLSTPVPKSDAELYPSRFTQKEIITLLNQCHPARPIQLASADISGLDLSGLNFRGCNLRFANLEGSILKYCNLAEANLQDANLKKCDLRYSDLSYGNLKRVQLQNAQLQYSTVVSCDLSDAELTEASLQNADFQNSLLSGANLQGANLQDINLSGAKLQGTSLYKAVNVQRAKGLKR